MRSVAANLSCSLNDYIFLELPGVSRDVDAFRIDVSKFEVLPNMMRFARSCGIRSHSEDDAVKAAGRSLGLNATLIDLADIRAALTRRRDQALLSLIPEQRTFTSGDPLETLTELLG